MDILDIVKIGQDCLVSNRNKEKNNHNSRLRETVRKQDLLY